MLAWVAALLVVFLVAYETTLAFSEYREKKDGKEGRAGRLVLKLILLFLVSYVLIYVTLEVGLFVSDLPL